MNKVAYGVSETIEPVLQPEDIFAIREVIDKIHVDEKIINISSILFLLLVIPNNMESMI